MAALPPSPPTENISGEQNDSDLIQKIDENQRETPPNLPTGKGWMTEHLVQYQGFWFSPKGLENLMWLHDHFNPRPTDIFLASFPKTGTTWLKALVFATVNRTIHGFSDHPLLTANPQVCVPFLGAYLHEEDPSFLDLDDGSPTPRLLSTHVPYALLPDSMTADRSCRFVYIYRDPKDVLVSKWHFLSKRRPKELPPFPLEEAFELFCRGISHYGPFWDHVLGFWKASLELPEKILFLKYEDLKEKPLVGVKRIGEFLGFPFSLEEEREGVVQDLVKLCSFESLSNLEVNRTGVHTFSRDSLVDNSHFFRKGIVGDWKNYLTPEMIKRLDEITSHKLSGPGLLFQNS